MVRETPLFGSHFGVELNMNVLPRQARDKRRKSCEKKGRFLQA